MSRKIFGPLGASNHTKAPRDKFDYYATAPEAGRMLLALESFENILEPACGEGHLAETLNCAKCSDLIDRGYGEVKNFFSYTKWEGDIVTNPPYKIATPFIKHALNIIPDSYKVAMFLKIQYLEGQGRRSFFQETPPRTIYVSSSRIICAKNGEFDTMQSSAVCYCWYIWVKGQYGATTVRWFN